MVSCLNHDLVKSVTINNKDHRERILSIKSNETEAHSVMHDTQPLTIHLKNGDQTQSKIENYDHNDEMKDEFYSSDSSDSSEERSEGEDNGSDGGNNGTIEQESDDDDENEDDENGDDRDDEEFHGNRQQQSQLNYERYMQSLTPGEIISNTGNAATPPPRKRGRPFKIRDENHPNYVKQKYKKNQKMKKDKIYESIGNGSSTILDSNGKRKRGRPPGKKNQPKYNNFSDSDNSPNSPISVIIPTTSPNIYKKQYQHPSPSLSTSSSSVTTPISQSNSSAVPFEQIVKKGRGRPKKSASGCSTTLSETSSDNQYYHQPITPSSSSSSSLSLSLSQWSNTKLKLPTDFEICNFVKDLIIENNRTIKIDGTEKDDLSASQVIRKLESYYGVDFSCRKWFLHEIVEVLAV